MVLTSNQALNHMLSESLARIERVGLIPIVVSNDPSKVLQLGREFLDLGLDVVEVIREDKERWMS